MVKENKIDPFGSSEIKDYDKILREFGVESIQDLNEPLPNPIYTFRRGIVFGHRDIGLILDAIKNKKKFVVLHGIKPTGPLHFGSKMVIDGLVYFQKLGGIIYYCVADVEGLADNAIPLEKAYKIARDNIIDAISLGLDPKKTVFYFQSKEPIVQKYGYIFSNNVTNNMMKAIYGEREIKIYMIALMEVADILFPQIQRGNIPTIIPGGFDQDPHIRLTRDIAKKHGFIPPASSYHKFMSSLTGASKMSKRDPEGIIYLNEPAEVACRKIKKKAFTGGRNTPEEQRQLGGQPEICKVYELYEFGLIDDDKELAERYNLCTGGKLMCGDCKKFACEKMTKLLDAHQKKRKEAEKFVDKILK